MSYNPRRPRMVLADETHPDYFRYTLRNGTTNPKTLQSFFNQPDLSNYVNSQKRMAGFYLQHPMKEMRAPEVYDEASGGRSMDVDSRLEIKAYKGKYPSVAEKLQTIVSFYPQFRDEANNREFKEKINNKLKEIDDKLPTNLPRRKEVMEKLISKYIMNHFEDKLGLMGDRRILGSIERLQERNEVSDRLLEQLTMQLRGEREATDVLDEDAVVILSQSQTAIDALPVVPKAPIISDTSLTQRLNKLKDIKKRNRKGLVGVSEALLNIYNIPTTGIDFNETRNQTTQTLILNLMKSELNNRLKHLPQPLKDAIKNTTAQNIKAHGIVNKIAIHNIEALDDKIRSLENQLPEAPTRTPVRGEEKTDVEEGALEREALKVDSKYK